MEAEFEPYLAYGILAHGFARVRCGGCGDELLVAFSCKGRGFCPSCTTRRMDDMAARLVDRVLPRVPVRQWVLSLPKQKPTEKADISTWRRGGHLYLALTKK